MKNRSNFASAYSVQSFDNKYVIVKNGEVVKSTQTSGQQKITEFDNIGDANKYMEILVSLDKNRAK